MAVGERASRRLSWIIIIIIIERLVASNAPQLRALARRHSGPFALVGIVD